MIFWLDVVCLSLSVTIGFALVLIALGAGIKKPVNRCFVMFATFETAWSLFSLLLRLSLRFELGNPELFAQLTALSLSFMSIFLALFVASFTESTSKSIVRVAIFGSIAVAAMSPFLFSGLFISDPVIQLNGSTTLSISPIGYAIAALPVAYMVAAFVISVHNYRTQKQRFLIVSSLVILVGFIFGGIFELPMPILAITNTIGLSVIGYAVIVRQIFNPLRDLAHNLQVEINERKRTETVLRESEEQFRNLAEESPNMIFIKGESRIFYANAMCSEVMGYSRKEFLSPGFDILTLIAPEDHDKIANNIARHFQGEELQPYEYGLVTKNGRRLECIITTKLISFNREPAILGIITDISRQKESERFFSALNSISVAMLNAHSPEEVFSAVGENLKSLGILCAVYQYHAESRTLHFRYDNLPHESAKAIKGILAADTRVEGVPTDRPGLFHDVAVYGKSVLTTSVELWMQLVPNKDYGRALEVAEMLDTNSTILCPLYRDKAFNGMFAIQSNSLSNADIPVFTAFANQLSAAWDKAELTLDLENSLTELTKTQSQLLQSQKMEAIGKLAGGVAHDFNNLLTAISGYTDLLFEDAPTDSLMRADLGEIKKATRQAASLTRQLLAFSRKQVMQPDVLDLNDILSNLQKMLKRLIGENIELFFNLEPELDRIKADPGQIEQVIINLCVNSKDALPDGGAISLDTSNVTLSEDYITSHTEVVPGKYVLLSVSDTGVGMDKGTKERMFEPFFTTKARGEGTGLGLSTAYGIVKQSFGHIWVYSEPGQGTTFKIYFPAVDGESLDLDAEDERSVRYDGTEHILLVEDEATVRELIVRVLTGYGYTVTAAKDANEALRLSEPILDQISLVVTDVIMPGTMTGRDLADALHVKKERLKVLFISGYTGNVIVHHGVLQDGVEFLQKPFAPTDIAKRVRDILDKTD